MKENRDPVEALGASLGGLDDLGASDKEAFFEGLAAFLEEVEKDPLNREFEIVLPGCGECGTPLPTACGRLEDLMETDGLGASIARTGEKRGQARGIIETCLDLRQDPGTTTGLLMRRCGMSIEEARAALDSHMATREE